MRAEHIIREYVQPGDLILTKTPSKIFKTLRELGRTDYDHVLAVIDQDRSLHVSYPFAKLVPTSQFVQKKKCSFILRPKFSPNARGIDKAAQFTDMLKQSLVGKAYDYPRVIKFCVASQLSFLVPSSQMNEQHIQEFCKSVICMEN